MAYGAGLLAVTVCLPQWSFTGGLAWFGGWRGLQQGCCMPAYLGAVRTTGRTACTVNIWRRRCHLLYLT